MAAAAKVNPRGERVKAKTEPCLNPKKGKASVIPPKRRPVKRMMFDLLVQFAASLCYSASSASID